MKRLLTAFLLLAALPAASAADRTIDLSSGCKVYRLENKQWVPTDGASMEGLGLTAKQILKDETFTVFKIATGTFGVNQKCIRAADAPPEAPTHRRAAAPAPVRGELKTPWAAVFAIGYSAIKKAEVSTTVNGGAPVSGPVSFKSAFSFLGEANYRFNAAFRAAFELGLSQLSVDDRTGNETSFFDLRPEYILRVGPKLELYIGPMIGLFFFSQPAETRSLPDGSLTLKVPQQTATTVMYGIGIGADYAISPQFDVGFFFRYFKPGTMTTTADEVFPTPTNKYESKLTTSYLTIGPRFVVHF